MELLKLPSKYFTFGSFSLGKKSPVISVQLYLPKIRLLHSSFGAAVLTSALKFTNITKKTAQ